MKRKRLLTAAVFFLLLAVVFAGLQLRCPGTAPVPAAPGTAEPASTPFMPQTTEKPESSADPGSEEIPYSSPVDFGALCAENPDIRAWLDMPGLEISAPVVCRAEDNGFYLRRDLEGRYSDAGSYFIENYNAFDFSDPVTIIYGHNMSDGSMMGRMQERYSDAAHFAQKETFTVYTPEAALEYRIFAAVPYSNRHILYYNNFDSFPVLEKFLKEIYSIRSLSAMTDPDTQIREGDRLVILSTCLDGNSDQRFLVIGVCEADIEK